MRSRIPSILVAVTVIALIFESVSVFARGGGGRGGGGGARGGGGSFSRPSGGGSYSRPSGGSGGGSFGGSSLSRPSGGSSFDGRGGFTSPSQLPSSGASRPSGGRVPSAPATRPSGSTRPSLGGSATELPSLGGGSLAGNRPSQLPTHPGAGSAARPGTLPAQRPGSGNFLGAAAGGAAGAALGGAIANRPSTLPANHPGAGQLPSQRPGVGQRPEQRPNWNNWSQNRNDQWKDRVNDRDTSWNNWGRKNQDRLNNFENSREGRWNNLEGARADTQNWRDQNRQDWQSRRQDLWQYRGARASQVWNNARNYYDDVFDDRWWGGCGWGIGWGGYYPVNPWWWWATATWDSVETYVEEIPPDPIYSDYGMNVIYEGETVYVDNQPVPADQYTQPMLDLAVNALQAPPPLPPAGGQPAEWMPLGVFALAQEEKGDPILFFQLSVNREGQITGAYKSTLANDQRPVIGQVDKATRRVAWRIGENKQTIFITSLANLTQEVAPLALHFGTTSTQTWLLVRMPEPAPAGQEQKLPEPPTTPPPLTKQVKAK